MSNFDKLQSTMNAEQQKIETKENAPAPIFVTQPALPPLLEFLPYLEQIWSNKVLTNGGPFHQQFERKLAAYLGVEYVSLFANATLALVTALQALRITGEVITTPYSFVATAHSLKWNGIEPIFVDIDPSTGNLDPTKIEAAITPRTTAILPVHVYGNPCDVDAIERIAENYNLKVIYDAAHAFGCKHNGQSLCAYGDLSVVSFHATKVFNTFEGGAIICKDAKTKAHIDHLKNFGFVDETTVVASGINGKMSEFNAAFGLLQLEHIDNYLAKRQAIARTYFKALEGVTGILCLNYPAKHESNHSYFPILVRPEFQLTRDELYDYLKQQGIHGRRYFYPLISDFPMYRGLPSAKSSNVTAAKELAEQVICLPIYVDLTLDTVRKIAQLIKDAAQ